MSSPAEAPPSDQHDAPTADESSSPTAPASPHRPRPRLLRLSRAVESRMRRFFFRTGYIVARRPLLVVAVSLLLTVASLAGMLRFRTESRGPRLWIPLGSVALSNLKYVNAYYGRGDRFSELAITPRTDAAPGLASRAALSEVARLAEAGLDVSVKSPDDPSETLTWRSRCVTTTDDKNNTFCRTMSALNLFYNTSQTVQYADGGVNFFASVRKALESVSDAQIRKTLADPPAVTFDGTPFPAGNLYAARAGTAGDAERLDIRVLNLFQALRNAEVERDDELADDGGDALEEVWARLVLEEAPGKILKTTLAFVSSQWSMSESEGDSISSDLPLLMVGLLLLAVYVVLFLGDFHSVRSHMWLGVGSLLTNLLAIATCFGLSSAFGMFYGPVHQILPLLIVGIGIDDCFHITRAVDDVAARPDAGRKPVEARVALALSSAGSAITVTSFTNVVVFLFSAISGVPAIRYFSLWASIGIFFAWVYAISFYTALVTLDLRRIDARRRDCLPCCTVSEVKQKNWFGRPRGGFSRFFGKQYGPFIVSKPMQIAVGLLFAAGLAAGIYGCTQLGITEESTFLFPEGSPQREFDDVVNEWYEFGGDTQVYVRNTSLRDPANRAKLLRLCDPRDGAVAKNEWIEQGSVDCWYARLIALDSATNLTTADGDTFVQSVKDFIGSGIGARYNSSVVFDDAESDIVTTRFAATYKHRETNDKEQEALKSLRETTASVGFGAAEGNPAAFPYSFRDIFTDQNASLPGEIGLSLGLACVAVAVVCFVLIGHPTVAVISVLVVGMIIVNVLGLTYWSDIQLNTVSVITLVLCAGISVDFVVHIARTFLEFLGSRRERAALSLQTVGPPVFYAGMSTFLAIIVLALAKSYAFQVFFRGFAFLLLMAFLHGLVLLPVILSVIGPPSFYADESDKFETEHELENMLGKTASSNEGN